MKSLRHRIRSRRQRSAPIVALRRAGVVALIGAAVGCISEVDNPPLGAGGSGGNGGSGAAGGGGSGGGTAGAGGMGTGGTAVDGGSAGTAGSGGTGGGGPVIPPPQDPCPTLANGTMTFRGRQVMIWVGAKQATPAPIVIYWHGTGSSPMEAVFGLGQAITAITGMGGLVVAPNASDGMGGKDGTPTTGNNVWYLGDFNTIDEIIGCAVQQLNIDTRHIHAAGMSAGGLQTAAMAYGRSSYVAGVVPYSGGRIALHPMLQDPSNVPAVMAVHGKTGSDVVVIDFATASAALENDIKAKGGFAMDCDHGGGHTIPAGIGPAAWQFMRDHPYKTAPPFPYAAGIPAALPTYCKIP